MALWTMANRDGGKDIIVINALLLTLIDRRYGSTNDRYVWTGATRRMVIKSSHGLREAVARGPNKCSRLADVT
jgi:hypothetical protein